MWLNIVFSCRITTSKLITIYNHIALTDLICHNEAKFFFIFYILLTAITETTQGSSKIKLITFALSYNDKQLIKYNYVETCPQIKLVNSRPHHPR